MIWQLKLLVGALMFAPIFCEAMLEDAFDSDVELLAEETDLSAASARVPRAAGYFYANDHYPRFNSPPGPKGYLPPPRFNQQFGYGNPHVSDDYDYDYDVPRGINRPHSHHHHHRGGGHHCQNPPNRGFPNNGNNGRPIQVSNPFRPPNNGRPLQGPPQVGNTFFPSNNRGPIQAQNPFLPSNNGRPIVTIPSQAPPLVNPRPVLNTTPIPIDQPTPIVATSPTTTSSPLISSTPEGDPFNIDVRFGN